MLTQYVAGIPRSRLEPPKGCGDSLTHFYEHAETIWRNEIQLSPERPLEAHPQALLHWTRLLGITERQLRALVAHKARTLNETKRLH